MGLLGNLVKGAVEKGVGSVTEGISQGITKGVTNAVGKAAESIVAPKVKEVANAAADQMDASAKAMNESSKAINDAFGEIENNEEAKAALGVQADGMRAFAGAMRGESIGSFAESMNQYATEMGKKMKHCPKCDEDVLANGEFCPNCGGKLPKNTIADDYVCPKCGKQNVIETKFCVDCGTVLPGYEEEAERIAQEEAEEKAAEKASKEAAMKAKAGAAAAEASNAAKAAMKMGGDLLGSFLKKK